jgi:hypothetical protein
MIKVHLHFEVKSLSRQLQAVCNDHTPNRFHKQKWNMHTLLKRASHVSLSRELVVHFMIIFLSRAENDGGKGGLIDSIREALCLEADPSMLVVHISALAPDSIQEVAGVELHARGSCQYFERAA